MSAGMCVGKWVRSLLNLSTSYLENFNQKKC